MSEDIPGERPLFIVFGATGDLMQRKLLPAIFGLNDGKFHPTGAWVLGVARQALDDDGYRALALKALKEHPSPKEAAATQWAKDHLFYQSIGKSGPAEFRQLLARVKKLERSEKLSGDRVLYLAMPLAAIEPTIDGIGSVGLHLPDKGWTRIVLEKPFGEDLESSIQLNAKLHEYFDEKQVFRIDHYLGKETVQNLMVLRFSNFLFESVWNRDRVERVEITVAEELGVEQRAAYYEESGALRDMVQNHLTQLMTLMAMEVPPSPDAEAIRNEKVKVLKAIPAVDPKDAVFGQYRAGRIEGHPVIGYREEEGVSPKSRTDTFVALKLEIDNWKWHGVPFFLRTGKRLPRQVSQILVRFRRPPVAFFHPFHEGLIPGDELIITVQPNAGFDLVFNVKQPGHGIKLKTERMHFRYSEAFASLPDDYQTLLLDVLRGDPTLFVRADEVEESWRLYDRLLKHPPAVQGYPAGAWGPKDGRIHLSPPRSPGS
jgi:glucose-6-phosphate 1-dehydrogenase